jgi:ATP-dependent helicase/nuclease subunit A
MYVATTRAKDHLVVSLYRGKRSSGCPAETIEGLCAEVPHLWRTVELSGVWSNPIPEAPAEAITIDTAEDRGVWLEKRYAILQKASRPAAIGVTALARDGKEEEERGEIAYRRGRAGTSIGRAVHSVLQTIDLATGSGLEEVSRAQAAVESIPERWREVAHLAKVALEADVVRRAVASQRYYREVFVGMPLDGWLLEGFIDLLFETPEGYVIIDYKTDRLDKEEGLEASRQRYSFQAGAYALAVYEALGRPVSEVVLLFLHACREMAFADLDELMAGAKQRAEAAMAAV